VRKERIRKSHKNVREKMSGNRLDFGARTERGLTVRDFRVWRVHSVLNESIFGACSEISGKQITIVG
jgi:hypothetical protein